MIPDYDAYPRDTRRPKILSAFAQIPFLDASSSHSTYPTQPLPSIHANQSMVPLLQPLNRRDIFDSHTNLGGSKLLYPVHNGVYCLDRAEHGLRLSLLSFRNDYVNAPLQASTLGYSPSMTGHLTGWARCVLGVSAASCHIHW